MTKRIREDFFSDIGSDENQDEQLFPLINGLSEGVIICDLEGYIQMVNASLVQLTEYSRDELIGEHSTTFLWDSLEEEKLRPYLKLQKAGRKSTFESIITTHRGNLRWVNVSSAPFKNRKGELLGSLLLFTDISRQKILDDALKRSEQKHRLVFENMNSGVLQADKNGITTFVSKKMCELTGYEEDELIGSTGTLLLPESAQHIPEEKMRERREGHKSVYEIEIQKKDGSLVWVNVSASPITDAKGNFDGSLSIVTDISDQKRSRLRQEVVYAIAEKTNSLRPDINLLGEVIHDQLKKVMGAQNLYVALYNKSDDTLSFPFIVDEGHTQEGSKAYHVRRMSDGLTERIIRSKSSLLITESSFQDMEHNYKTFGKKPRCWLGVPLIVNDEIIGALVIQSYTAYTTYNSDDQEFLEYISNQISAFILRMRTHQMLIEEKEKKEAIPKQLLN